MLHTDSRRATDTSIARAWAVRSVYGMLLLAMLYHVQNKTAEQERIHRAMTGGLPQAVIAVEKVNQLCFQEIEDMVESYPIGRHRDYLGVASSIWKHATAYSALLSGIAELPGKKERSKAFQNTMPDLIAMRDILLFGCDADYPCSQGLQSIVPDANDLFWRAISQWDAVRRTDMLRLQTALASSIALRYYDGRVRGSDCGSVGGRLPGLVGQQIFPAVGDWYEAVAFLSEYAIPSTSIRFKINGKPYPEKDGIVRYQHRFTHPGKHRLQVQVDMLATRDSSVLATSVQDFEINVLPRPLDSHNLKPN